MALKRVTLTAILIAILVGGIVFVNLSGFGTSISSMNSLASNGNGNGGTNENGAGNGNGNSGNAGNGNEGNGGDGNSNGNGNSGTGNNGNGNGNNENNGNGNNGNANGSGNGNGNSNGNDGNGNNGNGNNGTNGNSGRDNNGNDNGSGNQNGNGNNGSNGNSGNGNGGNNDSSTGNGDGNNNGNNRGNGNGADNGNSGNGSGDNGSTGDGNSGSGNGGSGGSNNGNSRYKISGYILDSNGKPIVGAQIIYCVPDIVPAQFSDISGYYKMDAPAGQYQVDVWPPFNSYYVFFEQKYLTVNSDMQMNITLQTGYRLSGVITTSSGAPVSGAVVWLDNLAQGNHYFCGWYSKTDGSYFVTAPLGTYTLKIQPKTGLSFPGYSEVVTITGDQVKNIVIGSAVNAQDPNAPQTSVISLSVGSNSLTVGSVLHLSGKLLTQNGVPLGGQTIILSYAIASSNVRTQIGSGTTDSTGLYKIDWFVPASGTFTLKVEWNGNSDCFPASSTTTLTFST